MGNREDLLQGAKRCLLDKGFDRTTVRDIANAAGVSMAAIGYHYGSREALLNAALLEAMEEWSTAIDAVLDVQTDESDSPRTRFEAMWGRILDSFPAHWPTWLASVEAALQASRSQEVRTMLAKGLGQGRAGQAAAVLGVAEQSITADTERSLGSVQMALLSGILFQWMADPSKAPDAADIVSGIQQLAAATSDES